MYMKKIISFVDNVGRVIVGQEVTSTAKQLQVKEPAVVNVQVNQQNGQISVQLLPFIFREFVKENVRESGVIWNFNKNNIVISENIELEDAIIKQYESIFTKEVSKPQAAEEQKPVEPEVVKLFDE